MHDYDLQVQGQMALTGATWSQKRNSSPEN